jgi:hypothetical protein
LPVFEKTGSIQNAPVNVPVDAPIDAAAVVQVPFVKTPRD